MGTIIINEGFSQALYTSKKRTFVSVQVMKRRKVWFLKSRLNYADTNQGC